MLPRMQSNGKTMRPGSAQNDAGIDHAPWPPEDRGWVLHRTGFDPAGMTREESLFALANGSLGVRGDPEDIASATGGCFLAGVYETVPIHYHEKLPGFAASTDTRVPVADGKAIRVSLDGRAVDEHAEWTEYERELDLRSGSLRRRSRLRTANGELRIDSERVVDLERDLLGIRFVVTSIDFAGALELQSRITASRSPARQGDDPRIGISGLPEQEVVESGANHDILHLVQCTGDGRIMSACAARHRCEGNAQCNGTAGVRDVESRFHAQLQPGQSVVLEKFIAWSCGADAVDAIRNDADMLARKAAAEGFAALAARKAQAMQAFWRRADLDADDDADTALALRLNLFHLFQSASRSAAHGTAAKGLTGEGYEGHCFWDTEAFVLPVMAFTAPKIARSMLLYRYRTLDAARANARALNHPRGALYAWRTIAGRECSAHYPSGSAAYHINAAVAYAIGLYLDATGDLEFLAEAGAEMLFETARIWLQVGHFDLLRDNAFCIHDVTGPDEYTALVDNNFYTNRMAQRHLQRAALAWDELARVQPQALERLAASLRLDSPEVESWRRAAAAMWLPVDARLGVFPQDDTFLHKPHWDFAAHANDGALLLHQHPLTLYRHQVCKQADVVMALALAGDGLDAAAKRRSFDYYEAITTHDSTLSAAIHAIVADELGLRDKAARYFDECARVDLDDLHGNSSHGVHMAAMAGSWLALAWGCAGLRVIGGELHFAPTLPPGWRGYRFALCWRGRYLRVGVDARGVHYTLAEGDALSIRHRGSVLTLQPAQPLTQPLRIIRALVFDLDGVLTDTARLHYLAWKRLADEIGVPFDETDNLRLKGVDRRGSLELLLERSPRAYSENEKHALAERKNGYYRDSLAEFGPGDLYPGVHELLAVVRARGLKLALASASRNAPVLLQRLGIADAFDAIADPARAPSKPDPGLFLAAASALDVRPDECIGIEDSAAGIEAIRAANMFAVGIGSATELARAGVTRERIGDLDLDALLEQAGSAKSDEAAGAGDADSENGDHDDNAVEDQSGLGAAALLAAGEKDADGGDDRADGGKRDQQPVG